MSSQPDIAQLSDPGKARNINCDRCVAIGSDGLGGRVDAFLLVADGMGANRRGDMASRITAEVAPASFVRELGAIEGEPTRDGLANALRKALRDANDAVWKAAQEDAELKGMGTTCVAAVVRGDTALLCHAGDSRAYVLSEGDLVQLTADHSLIQEVVPAEDTSLDLDSRFGTVITRGIGLSRSLDADLVVGKIGPKDALLLCTDGLTNMISETRIARILASAKDAAAACVALVAAANDAGGLDNIGVAVLRGPEFEPYEPTASGDSEDEGLTDAATRQRSRRRSRRSNRGLTALAVVLGLAVVVLGSLLYWEESERRRLLDENLKLRQQLLSFVDRQRR